MAAPTITVVHQSWVVEKENGPTWRVSTSAAQPLAWEASPFVGPTGATGPTGPTGPPGTGDLLVREAGATVHGHRAVISTGVLTVVEADPSDLSHLPRLLGVATGSAVLGASVDVVTRGPITEPSWSWTPGGPIYVGANGVLTQTPPTSGWLRVLGWAESATTMMVAQREPIVLG